MTTLPVIRGHENDHFSRWQMPKPEIAYLHSDKSVGRKTLFKNIGTIADELSRPVLMFIKFYQLRLSIQKPCFRGSCLELNGYHTLDSIITILYDFIQHFILCEKCELPCLMNKKQDNVSWKMKQKKKKFHFIWKCPNCSHKTKLDDSHPDLCIKKVIKCLAISHMHLKTNALTTTTKLSTTDKSSTTDTTQVIECESSTDNNDKGDAEILKVEKELTNKCGSSEVESSLEGWSDDV